MPTVADCLRQHAAEYLQTFGNAIPLGHRKVIGLINRCRTGQLGGVVYQCDTCDRQHWVGRSCSNRHCPNCQVDKTRQWLAKQIKRLLPTQHFLVTFTVPQELRLTLRANQKIGYRTLFEAGSQTIRKLLANPRYLGSNQVGFFGVLHTWGRDPTVYHPHVHFVVPAGGLSNDGTQWLSTPENFLFPHARAISLYKKLFANALRNNDLYDQVPVEAWCGKWVVDIQPVGDGQAALKYLAPYVYRVAISNHRILACNEQSVTFRYTPSGKNRSRTQTVQGTEFVRGFVQHTLPKGFQKVRYYGWMSPNSKIDLDLVRWLVWLYLGWLFWLNQQSTEHDQSTRAPVRCANCGQVMRIVEVTNPSDVALPEHAINYLDSG